MSPAGVIFKRQRGFSLIELVAAIGILSIIVTSSVFLFNSTNKVSYHLEDEMFVHQNARQALMWLSANIRRAKSAEIVSQDKIKLRLYWNNEMITFYLKNNVLYTEKNGGVNPIAQLNALRFTRPEGANYIEIEMQCIKNDCSLKLITKVTPIGSTASNH